MPVLKRTFSEMNTVRIGIAGVAVLIGLALLALNSGAVIRASTTTTYHAAFPEAGGLAAGDTVQIGGLTMGTVQDVTLQGSHVEVTFSVRHGGHLGTGTGAAIKTATALGTKYLALLPSGPGTLPAGATIPLRRTQSPYNLTQILSTLTTQAGAINTGQLARSFGTISSALGNAPPELRSMLNGVRSLSETIASRDAALSQLLSNAGAVTGVLAARSGQIGTLITDGNELLNTLYQRRYEIRLLLVNVTAVVDQLRGLVTDNQQQLGPALNQLRGVLTLLNNNAANITQAIAGLERYASGLGDVVGGGPYFYAYIQNIVPTSLQPTVPTTLGK
ncbi:MAG TPA: MCE family protein [Streptosporangiaceae bacterium]|jgi:phospholipid/cholesterol/gamma-HCH transport system substrate-binding protein|nr:MCE family protein [Streptosporangiaceae bacterium]